MNSDVRQTNLACGLAAAWERLLEASENPFEHRPAAEDTPEIGTAPAPAPMPSEFEEFWRDAREQIRRAVELTRQFAEAARESVRDARELTEKTRLATENAAVAAESANLSARAAHAAAGELEWLVEEVRRTEDRLRSGRPSGSLYW